MYKLSYMQENKKYVILWHGKNETDAIESFSKVVTEAREIAVEDGKVRMCRCG